jgi:hypothetical protein
MFGAPAVHSWYSRQMCTVLDACSEGHIIVMSALNISKKRKFVADGVFYSELNEVDYFYIDCVSKIYNLANSLVVLTSVG